jgi:hypothetical protein
VGGFFFATELATKGVVTDDYYTDGRVPSAKPSVIISPTAFIPDTDGISPSVKLFNGIVNVFGIKLNCLYPFKKVFFFSGYHEYFLIYRLIKIKLTYLTWSEV